MIIEIILIFGAMGLVIGYGSYLSYKDNIANKKENESKWLVHKDEQVTVHVTVTLVDGRTIQLSKQFVTEVKMDAFGTEYVATAEQQADRYVGYGLDGIINNGFTADGVIYSPSAIVSVAHTR